MGIAVAVAVAVERERILLPLRRKGTETDRIAVLLMEDDHHPSTMIMTSSIEIERIIANWRRRMETGGDGTTRIVTRIIAIGTIVIIPTIDAEIGIEIGIIDGNKKKVRYNE